MPCDSECVKIIINGRFMTTLAPSVLQRYESETVRKSVSRLSEAAAVLIEMAEARGLSADAAAAFDGCEQAKTVLLWIRGADDGAEYSSAKIAEQINAWTADLWQHIADIVTGKSLG